VGTSTQILADIDLRYRNTFTVSQKLVWFNEEQRELFDVLELDSPPLAFTTVIDENFYPFPDQFDVTKIKAVTYQINDSNDSSYIEIPFKRNDDNQAGGYGIWYTIASDALYLYVAGSVPDDRNVYIYTDADPQEVTLANVESSPELPVKYQEILKLGVLKRIAGARKDIQMRNSFDMEYQQKVDDIIWQRRLKEPEFIQPIDMTPRVRSNGTPYRSHRGF
jgi:hypothetical protein